jgi:hypothetical protein
MYYTFKFSHIHISFISDINAKTVLQQLNLHLSLRVNFSLVVSTQCIFTNHTGRAVLLITQHHEQAVYQHRQLQGM